jgi:hypothetical protein
MVFVVDVSKVGMSAEVQAIAFAGAFETISVHPYQKTSSAVSMQVYPPFVRLWPI